MQQEWPNYRSYLLRLWRSSDQDAPWLIMLVNPHTSERHSFSTLAELIAFLAQIVDDSNDDH